jgi:hypothetical protein
MTSISEPLMRPPAVSSWRPRVVGAPMDRVMVDSEQYGSDVTVTVPLVLMRCGDAKAFDVRGSGAASRRRQPPRVRAGRGEVTALLFLPEREGNVGGPQRLWGHILPGPRQRGKALGRVTRPCVRKKRRRRFRRHPGRSALRPRASWRAGLRSKPGVWAGIVSGLERPLLPWLEP